MHYEIINVIFIYKCLRRDALHITHLRSCHQQGFQEHVTCDTNVCLLTLNVTQAYGTMVMVMGTEFPVGLGHLIYAGIE